MEERIGSVKKLLAKTPSAAVKLEFGDRATGDSIHIKGTDTNVTQQIDELESDHHPVRNAIRGQFIGIKLSRTAKPFDLVYKVTG